jgi:hypothetical protein
MFRLGFFSRSAIASALLFFILSVFATANVLTWHNDDARTGRNLSEKMILTPSNVNSAGVANALVDPTLELHDISGTLIASNDNWKSNQQAQIEATRLTPGDDRDDAILARLQPGDYTAIVRGSGGTTAVALVEAYPLH